MDRETAHKLLDLVLSAKHDGVRFEFTPMCNNGGQASFFIHEWDGDSIAIDICRGYTMDIDGTWFVLGEGRKCTTQEIIEVLEGLQDAEH